MYENNLSSIKREHFRQQIRRRQVESMFAEHRKAYVFYNPQQQQCYNAANNELMRKSLLKNQLLPEITKLLQALHMKISTNPSIENIQFVMALCANLLQDDISIDQKQYIYGLAMHTVGIARLYKMSPIVEVYIYDVIIGLCYSSLQQSKQVQIQSQIIPRLAQLLRLQNMQMSRINSKIPIEECIEEIYIECLNGFLHFYQPQQDHNVILLYKVKRTTNEIKFLISWWRTQYKNLQKCERFVEIFETYNAIFGNITQIPYQFHTLIGKQEYSQLIILLLHQLGIEKERLTDAKAIGIKVLCNLFENCLQQLQTYMTQSTIKILLHQLQYSISIQYIIHLIKFFNLIVTNISLQHHTNFIFNLLSLFKQVMEKQQNISNQVLLIELLKCVRSILNKGFQEGKSEYKNILLSIGGLKIIEQLDVTSKNEQISEIISVIEHYMDIC